MKPNLFLLVTLVATALQGQNAPEWKLDKSHASVQFGINHFFSEVPGSFSDFTGTFYFDENNLKGSKVEFAVKVASVTTGEPDRDSHLQSPDFFDAAKYPQMTFVSTGIQKTGANTYNIQGKLTIRDVTRTVTLPLIITGKADNPWKEGAVIMGWKIETTLDRTQYGVGTGSWAATAIVGDEVRIKVQMELDGKK
jgi:polyisoprenoid-binding protein YceI